MFFDRVNKEELSVAAENIIYLLKKYCRRSDAARCFLEKNNNIFIKALNKEINTPQVSGFFPEEFWEDGALFGFRDLAELISNFNLLLQGYESLNEIQDVAAGIQKKSEMDETELFKKLIDKDS